MKTSESLDYLAHNRASWNKRVATHMASDFYDLPAFLDGKSSLNSIELELLGDVNGKSILHLQCHFGQDSISLARMGAQVTGVDLSDEAIRQAEALARQTGADARFICTDVYSLPEVHQASYDIVFSSYGTIGWLPDLDRWAAVVSRFLKPGGVFVFAEFHPVVWMYDNDFTHVTYSYFKAEPIVETSQGTYADKEAAIETTDITWNHGLSEVIGSLLKAGLRLESFQEYDYSPYPCFNKVEEFLPGKYRLQPFDSKIPLTYSILASKN